VKAQDLAARVAEDLAAIEQAHRDHFQVISGEFARVSGEMDAEVAALRDVLQEMIEADRFWRRVGRRIRGWFRRA